MAVSSAVSAGEFVADAPEVRAFRDGRGFGAEAVNVPLSLALRAINSAVTSGGAFSNPERPTYVPSTNAARAPHLFDVIGKQRAEFGSVEYVRDTSAAPPRAAAERAEESPSGEATITFELVTDTVASISEHVPITRQAYEDNAALASTVDRLLEHDLLVRADSQIVNGNGVAPNLRGIRNVTGVQTYTPGGPEARIISVRKGRTKPALTEYVPDAIAVHPTDLEIIDLSADTAGAIYAGASAFDIGPHGRRLWGMTVIETTAVPVGTAVLGNFAYGATLWLRYDNVVIRLSDDHASNFVSNIRTVQAELRCALSVWAPKAFCVVTFVGSV